MLPKRIICLITLVVIGALIFISCSSMDNVSDQSEDDAGLYSRERVESLASGNGFGYGRTDVETLVLLYVYNNSDFAEKYGADFSVDSIGGSDTAFTFLISWLYGGTGKYYVEIDGDRWCVSVAKDYFGKWEIIDCYQDPEE